MSDRRQLLASVAISVLVHALALSALRPAWREAGEGGTAFEMRIVGIVELAAASEIPSREPPPKAAAEAAAEPAPEPMPPPPEPREDAARIEPALGPEAEAEPRPAAAPPEPVPPPAPPAPEAEISSAGEVGVPGDAEATRGLARDLRARYIAGVLARIHAAKRYPPQSRWRGEEGLAEVEFAIEADGRVSSVELTKPSGRPLLDAEARALVRRAAPFEEIPRELGSRIRLVVPIRFELKTGR